MRSANYLLANRPVPSAASTMQLLAARRGSVRGFVSDAAFWDIGTPEDLAQTSAEFEEQEGVGSLFRSGSAKRLPTPFLNDDDRSALT